MKRQKPHLGFLPVAAAHLARPPGGPVGWPSPASVGHRLQPPASRQEGMCSPRAGTRRPPPASAAAPTRLDDATRPSPTLSHSLSSSSLPLDFPSLSQPSASSPPSTATVATAALEPLRHVPELRHDVFVLSTKSRCARSSAASPTPLFSSSVVRDRRHPYIAVRPSPSPRRRPLQPL